MPLAKPLQFSFNRVLSYQLSLRERATMNVVQILFLFCAFLLAEVTAENEPINLTLFYETLCPDTRKFVLEELVPTYRSALQSHINLELVPFGNAKFHTDDNGQRKVECQHGEEECYGNRLQACYIVKYSPNISRSLDYVNCMFEKEDWKSTHNTSVKCATELSINWNNIEQCTNSAEGERLIEIFGNQTLNLDPKVTWIPWLTINNQHDDKIGNEALSDLKKYLCDYHFNKSTLDACKSSAFALGVNCVVLMISVTVRMFLW